MLRTRHPARLLTLAAVLAGSGTLHLTAPHVYRRIVPHILGHANEIVTLSGIVELACAALLLHPRSRTAGAYATTATFIAVFPANIQMALDGGIPDAPFPAGSAAAAWLRLPLQLPLILWALSLRKDAS